MSLVQIFGQRSGRVGTYPAKHQVQDIATGLLGTEMHLVQGNVVAHLQHALLQNGEQAVCHGRHLLAHYILALLHILDLRLYLRERLLWQGEVFCCYLGTRLGEGNEVGFLLYLGYGNGIELVKPLGLEPLARTTEEMHLHAYGFGQALHLLGREFAPGVEHVKLLLQFVLLVQKHILLHLQFLHLFQEVQGSVVLGGKGV